MLATVRLTFRMHRFEVLAAGLALALVMGSAVVAHARLTDAAVSGDCRQQADVGTTDAACSNAVNAFYAAQSEAGLVLGAALGLPIVVGLVLGVPIVGAEVEMRTTTLAWSLSGDRRRWLLQRFLPVLALSLAGLAIASVLLSDLRLAVAADGSRPNLDDLGTSGPTLIGRGLLALGIALFAGAVIGRTLPGFLIATAVTVVLVFGGAHAFQEVLAKPYSVWVAADANDGALIWLDFARRDRDGRILNRKAVRLLVQTECRGCVGRTKRAWVVQNLTPVVRIVPVTAFPAFERAETAASVGIGGFAILLTFPVVARRKPA